MTAGDRLREGIRRSRVLIVVTMVIGVGAAFGAAALEGPLYAATASVLSSAQNADAVLGTAGSSDPDLQSATDIALTQSAGFDARVARRLGPSTTLPGAFVFDSQGGTNLLSVRATGTTPEAALRIANAAADEFVAFRAQVTSDAARRSRDALERRLAQSPRDESVKQAISRLNVVLGLSQGGAAVSESASSAEKVRPQPIRTLVIGLVAGLVVGLMLMAAREALTVRIRDEADLEELLGLPVLATAPRLSRRTRTRPRGAEYERLALALADVETSGPTAVAIVSAVAGEGRTTTVAAIAEALAARGARVCAADTGDPQGDLGTLVSDAQDGLNKRGAASSGPGFVALASEKDVLLREGKRIPSLVDELREGHDWLLLDTPPALISSIPDDLARRVDVLVLVVRPSTVSRRDLVAFARQIARWPTRPHGIIVTPP